MKNPSLVRRVVLYLVLAQFVAFAVAWIVTVGVGLAGVEMFATSLEELASVRAAKQVISSLIFDKDGVVRIEPDDELRAEMRRAPNMKVAAFRGPLGEALPGSSPELAAALAGIIKISPDHTHFVLPGDPTTYRLGLMEPRRTPFGRLHIAVYGLEFRWSDLFHVMEHDMRWLATYVVAAILMSAATARFAVRRGLAPLHTLAEEASRIDMDSLGWRLPSQDVPAEINPFVASMNRALERLDAGATRLRRFTANAAHELRTPVAILSARLDAAEEPTFKLDLKRDARRIRNIVEQLLATAKLGEKREALLLDVDLAAVARGAVADTALLAIRNRRHVAFEAPAGPLIVRADRVALESVVANLIDNALRAEPEDGVVVVRVNDDATVDVVDHGEGVAAPDRELVFEPFWRKTDAKPGIGLGLAIAREIVVAHGGRIWVEETPGGGATFKLSFKKARRV